MFLDLIAFNNDLSGQLDFHSRFSHFVCWLTFSHLSRHVSRTLLLLSNVSNNELILPLVFVKFHVQGLFTLSAILRFLCEILIIFFGSNLLFQ